MLFRKRRKPGVPQRSAYFAGETQRAPEYYVIEREMMLKGSEVPRGGKTVRQFAVMINGSVHVVTSGDTVNRAIYEALLAANAIMPLPGTAPQLNMRKPPVAPLEDISPEEE